MDSNPRREPRTGLEVHEQISKLLEEFLQSTDDSIPVTWAPVMDIPRLRPN